MSLERIDIEDDDVRERWAAVDMEILAIVEDILDDAAETGMDTVLGEGDMIIDVLDRMRHWVQRFRWALIRLSLFALHARRADSG